jgi:hypothetical protein
LRLPSETPVTRQKTISGHLFLWYALLEERFDMKADVVSIVKAAYRFDRNRHGHHQHLSRGIAPEK